MRSPTIANAPPRWASAHISPSRSSHAWSWPRFVGGSATEPRRSRLATELSASAEAPRTSDGKLLTRNLFVAYVGAWATGILYGLFIRATSTWDEGAAWERHMLRWFHA